MPAVTPRGERRQSYSYTDKMDESESATATETTHTRRRGRTEAHQTHLAAEAEGNPNSSKSDGGQPVTDETKIELRGVDGDGGTSIDHRYDSGEWRYPSNADEPAPAPDSTLPDFLDPYSNGESAGLSAEDCVAQAEDILRSIFEATAETSVSPLTLQRHFTTPGVDPYDEVRWELRTALIVGVDGTPVFEQREVEFPVAWSQNATNVVASKYFRGPLVPTEGVQRERSVKQLIDRVVNTLTDWGSQGGYFSGPEEAETFRAELKHILVQQKACFNSPVWFNLGIEEKPQCSACFILSIEDEMDSILDWYKTEGRIFKGGSGSGINLSKLRSSKERVAAGGLASGPVSFMRGADAIAGTIKSGGKTRRAAKMVVLNVDHPDIEEYIDCKRKEERKAYTLGEAGYDTSLDGDAWISIQYQNANNSVRVTEEFMQAVQEGRDWQTRLVKSGEVCDTIPARDLMRRMAQAAWECADPGIQYHTEINDWHTCPNSGPITASNPCSEYMHLDDSACNLASINLLQYVDEAGAFDIEAYRHTVAVLIAAQEIIVSNSSYPTEKIRQNAFDYRQLGLGYSNLGALLMSLGIPYNSDEGRAWASGPQRHHDRPRLRHLRRHRRPHGPLRRLRAEPRADAGPSSRSIGRRPTASTRRSSPRPCWRRPAPPGTRRWNEAANTATATPRPPSSPPPAPSAS